jgi:SnoaL-like protein
VARERLAPAGLVKEAKTMTQSPDPDAAAIRAVVENWALWRDAGDWERFATVWHADGWMGATWFQGPATKFIEASRRDFERGVSILHFLGGSTSDIAGTRAISQTKMTISQRAPVDGVMVDVVCTGRFYDFFEKRPLRNGGDEERWAIARRQPIYEKDRLDPVDPSQALRLDPALLGRFPEGYRHLAYLQSKNGFTVAGGLPGLRGAEVEKLYAEGRAWLAGSAAPGVLTQEERPWKE